MLSYSGGTYRSGELCYDCSISSDLTEMVKLPTQIPDFDSHSPALLEIFIFLTIVFLRLGSGEFRGNASNLLNKGKSAILLYSTARRCCLLHLIKQNCLLKTFLGILILMIQVSPCMLSLLELI